MASPKSKIVHLIPYDGIGGVERAAGSMRNVLTKYLSFQVRTILPAAAAESRWLIWNPWYYFYTIVSLWRNKPSILIVSLWRSYAVGIFVKLLCPKLKLIIFLHFPRDSHQLDRVFTVISSGLASQVWADSKETLDNRLSGSFSASGRVISFVTQHIKALPPSPARPVFIFWGRIHAQKNLTRAVRLFAEVRAYCSDAQFWIIGPDGGDLERVKSEVSLLNLSDAVSFLGPKTFDEIVELAGFASFYLQTSTLEGMAMSVVEAMQFGLVPVVTPAGEIAHYAIHGLNSVLITDNSQAATDIFALLEDDNLYQKIRAGAISKWSGQSLYKDSVLSACKDVLRT